MKRHHVFPDLMMSALKMAAHLGLSDLSQKLLFSSMIIINYPHVIT